MVNPVVCVPLWSVILHAVFTLTGVSMAAARTTSILFGIALIAFATMLFRRHYPQSSWIVFVLLAASSTLFVFSRLALLEVPMMAFCLAGMLLAPRRGQSTAWRVPLSALLLAAAVLIKIECALSSSGHTSLYLAAEPRARPALSPLAPASLRHCRSGGHSALHLLRGDHHP